MDITLREAAPSDCDRIATMVSTVASEHIGPSLYDGGIEVLIASLGPEPTRKRILDNWFHLCALKDEKLIGVVVVRPPSHLYHLFVVSDLQRQGIGGQLFAAADAATIANSQSRISTVNSSLNAVPVYERLGFSKTSRSRLATNFRQSTIVLLFCLLMPANVRPKYPDGIH